MPVCASCGEDNPERAKFCLSCASPLAIPGATTKVRKLVTVVFCDLAGSTSMGERLDPEALRAVMQRYYASMRDALERHGGRVEKFIGDAVMAVFGVPTSHEDDALRAVRAATDMRASLQVLNEELEHRWGARLQTRTGVNTGEVVTGAPSREGSFVVGDAVNVAARLEQAAGADEILIGEQTYRLVRDAVRAQPVEPLDLKGKAAPVPALKLLEVIAGTPSRARRVDAPILGRTRELSALQEVFERALRREACEVVTVLGPAGVGKTRLISEFTARVGDRARVLHGNCLSYGEGITYRPVADVVKQAAGITDGDGPRDERDKISALLPQAPESGPALERAAGVVGLSDAPSSPEETAWAIRTLLEGLASQAPLVAVFEDIHWGEPTFLDLIEYLAAFGRAAPIMVLCSARPELVDARPHWNGAPETASLLPLRALSPEDSRRLLEQLLGSAEVADLVSPVVSARAGGNPLFVEELVRMLVDDAVLQRENGHWALTGDLAATSIPPTMRALLEARLDRLGRDERDMIECAAVIGHEFWPGALSHLAGAGTRSALQALVRKELVHPGGVAFAGDDAFHFSHILLRDAAYESIVKERRADLHERFADWLEQKAATKLAEHEEILGYHLEQAYHHAAAAVGRTARLDEVAARAGRYLSAAAQRAVGRRDGPAAVNLLQRALAVLPADDPARLSLMLELGLALLSVGDSARAEAVLTDTVTLAARSGDERLELHARLQRTELLLWKSTEATMDELRSLAQHGLTVFDEAGDAAGVARACYHLAQIETLLGQRARATDWLERALRSANAAQDRGRQLDLLEWLTTSLLEGPLALDDARRRFEAAVASVAPTRGDPEARPRLLGAIEAGFLAGHDAMRGDIEAARRNCGQAKDICREFGQTFVLALFGELAATVELLADAPDAAERELRWSYETLETMGETSALSSIASLLAEAALAQDRVEDAHRFSVTAERQGSAIDVPVQVAWRTVRAKVLARQGRVQEAERLATEAVNLAGPTDELNRQGFALLALGEVLFGAGRPDDAAAALGEALRLFEAKGTLVVTRQLRPAVEQLASG